MSTHSLSPAFPFPDGTVVKAYPRTNWPTPEVPSGAPPGAATAEGTVANGSVTFTGLAAGARYRATAEVGGVYRYVAFTANSDGTNTVVSVKKEEATEVAAANPHRQSLTLTNDSANVIYVFKGPSAAIGKGIRLGKEGGQIVIDDYNGLVTAAAATGASNLTVTES